MIDKASLHLQAHPVFEDLSLSFPGLQCHCVLGRSGVGKSSLLNIISGSTTLQSGSVNASNGKSLSGQTAYMFQDDGLLPWLNVVDNVQLGLRLRGETNRNSFDRAMDLLSAVTLTPWAQHLPASLSGGMRQRVALARTLMEDKAIILMDEPFSRLDAITRDELQELACKLLHKRTVIMVTHDPAEALRIGHTITVLHTARPSTTSTFTLSSQPARAHTNDEVLALTPAIWKALSKDKAHPTECL